MPLDPRVVGIRKDPLQIINRVIITNAVHLRSVSVPKHLIPDGDPTG